jgi:hypothetical protein
MVNASGLPPLLFCRGEGDGAEQGELVVPTERLEEFLVAGLPEQAKEGDAELDRLPIRGLGHERAGQFVQPVVTARVALTSEQSAQEARCVFHDFVGSALTNRQWHQMPRSGCWHTLPDRPSPRRRNSDHFAQTERFSRGGQEFPQLARASSPDVSMTGPPEQALQPILTHGAAEAF